MGNGDQVVGPAEGAVIYVRPGAKKYKRVLSSAPTNAVQGPQPVPHPTPGPTPGAGRGGGGRGGDRRCHQ